MGNRRARYLYIRESLSAVLLETEVGSGKTCRARICATKAGDPSAIGSSSASATASGGLYTLTIARATLVTDLAAMLNQKVYLHLDDGAAWHDVYEYVVTDVDPDLLADL